jgi:hypothetical protein
MRPATVHFVVTPESAICHGGHAYAMSTMMNTVQGIFATFVGSSVLTNTEHTKPTRHLLERMLIYRHDSLIMTSDSEDELSDYDIDSDHINVHDLLALCVLGEFGEILSPHSYNQPLDMHEQIFSMYARGCARNLVAWMDQHPEHFATADGKLSPGDAFWDMMENCTRTLVEYKRWGEKNDLLPDDCACTAAALESRLQVCFSGSAPFHYSDIRPICAQDQNPRSWTFSWPHWSPQNFNPGPCNINSTVNKEICERKCAVGW